MVDLTWTIYTAPEERIDAPLVRAFLDDQRDGRVFLESGTLELKSKRRGLNVVEAIAGLANAGGGIVLLGVDEDAPDLDASPGVEPEAQIGLAQQCQQFLDPVFMPEFIPVPISDTGRVVLVIRVRVDPHRLPVVVGGRVLVRHPGHTVPATHDQVLQLVARRSHHGSTQPLLNVASVFAPDSTRHDTDGPLPDLVVRCATSIRARYDRSGAITLGQKRRHDIADAVYSSPAVTLAKLSVPAPLLAAHPLELVDIERSARRWVAELELPGTQTTDRLTLDLRVNGPQIAFALDYELRRRPVHDPRPPVPRSDIPAITAALVATASYSVVPAVAEWMDGSPDGLEPVSCWLETPSRSLDVAIDLRDTHRPAAERLRRWCGSIRAFEPTSFERSDDLVAALHAPLTELYLDLGIDNEQAFVEADSAIASEHLQHQLGW